MRLRRTGGGWLRLVVALAAAGAVAGGAYVYTASNTVPSSQAGAGSSAISGYTVTSVAYTLDATDPTKIDSVAFTISPTTGTVKAQLVTSGTWYACTNTSGSVTCNTTVGTQATASTANQLQVVAAQ